MVLRSEDGTPLEIKQGVVLGPDDQVLNQPEVHGKIHTRSFSGRLPLPGVLGTGALLIFIPVAITAGFALFALIALVVAIFFAMKLFSSVFSKSK